MYSARFWRKLTWLLPLAVVLDLQAKGSSGLVPLVTGAMF